MCYLAILNTYCLTGGSSSCRPALSGAFNFVHRQFYCKLWGFHSSYFWEWWPFNFKKKCFPNSLKGFRARFTVCERVAKVDTMHGTARLMPTWCLDRSWLPWLGITRTPEQWYVYIGFASHVQTTVIHVLVDSAVNHKQAFTTQSCFSLLYYIIKTHL